MENALAKGVDFSVICGERGREAQTEAFNSGHSKVKFPNSKHNSHPSEAVDVCPWPIDFENINRFLELSVLIKQCWNDMSNDDKEGWTLHYGGDWKNFKDYVHWELRK
jgi:peptidoglycan L-alanyl-D-glutamate endopeptidase CwlK